MEGTQTETQIQTEQVIEIKDNDEIATIREQLQWAQSPRVMLVVAKKNKAMRERVNLRLVQRVAMDHSIQLGIVARHRDTVRLARELGIPVFGSVRSGARKRIWNGLRPSFVDEGDELKLVTPQIPKVSRQYQMLGLAILAVLVGVLGAGIVFLAPNAHITVSPLKDSVNVSVEVVANPAVKNTNVALGQIPARIEEIALGGTDTIVPIAKRAVPDKAAVAIVAFTNNTDQPLVVPKETFVSTSAGEPIRFRTLTQLDLAPRARAEISVTALTAGPTGNAPQFAINRVEGALAVSASVINARAATGGSVKQVPVVSAEDKKRLEEKLIKMLQQEAAALFKDKLQEQEFVAPESIQVKLETPTFSHNVDEPTELLSLTAQAAAKGTVVNGANANAVAFNRLESRVGTGFTLVPESINYIPGAVLSADPEKGLVRFEMKAAGQKLAAIDRQFIANNVRGMPMEQAEEWLRQRLNLRRPPVVELKSDWLNQKKMPNFAFRIDVTTIVD